MNSVMLTIIVEEIHIINITSWAEKYRSWSLGQIMMLKNNYYAWFLLTAVTATEKYTVVLDTTQLYVNFTKLMDHEM